MTARYHPVETNDTTASSISSVPAASSIFTGDHGGPVFEDHRPLLSTSTSIDAAALNEDIYEEHIATATPFSCAINLANTILGTGLLAMVSRVRQSYVVTSLLI